MFIFEELYTVLYTLNIHLTPGLEENVIKSGGGGNLTSPCFINHHNGIILIKISVCFITN